MATALALMGSVAILGAPAVHAEPTARPCARGGPCAVGDRGPGGGLVFLTPTSKRNTTGLYYEVAAAGWSNGGADPEALWCDDPTTSVPGTGFGMGTGEKNTAAIAAACASGAASLAVAYRGGGRKDWFLPSTKESRLLIRAPKSLRRAADLRGSDLDYWTSTFCPGGVGVPGQSGLYAWGFNFSDWTMCDSTAGPGLVRPVRSFR